MLAGRRGRSTFALCAVQILLCRFPSTQCMSNRRNRPNVHGVVVPARDLAARSLPGFGCTHRQMLSRRLDLRILRGGSSGTTEGSRRISVPSDKFPTLQDGLDATCANDTCVVSRGCHSFGHAGKLLPCVLLRVPTQALTLYLSACGYVFV